MKNILLLCLSSLAITGCKKTVTCSDQSTLELVNKVFIDSIDNSANSPLGKDVFQHSNDKQQSLDWIKNNLVLSLSSIQTISSNKENGEQVCKGTLNFKFAESTVALNNDKIKQLINSEDVFSDISYANNQFSNDINYKTSVTDDNQEQIVEVLGLKGASLFALFTGVGIQNEAKRGTNQNTTDLEFFGVYEFNSMADSYRFMKCHTRNTCANEINADEYDGDYILVGDAIKQIDQTSCQNRGDICNVNAEVKINQSGSPEIHKLISADKIGSI